MKLKLGRNNYQYLLLKSLCAIFLLSFSSAAQKSELITLPWGTPKKLVQGENSAVIPNLEGHDLNGVVPHFSWKLPLSSSVGLEPVLTVVSTSPADPAEIQYLLNNHIEVNGEKYELRITAARDEKNVVLGLFPFVLVNNSIHRINSVKVDLNNKNSGQQITAYQKDFVINSVLANGSGLWFKISVDKDGIYKIDKEFLARCFQPLGVDMATLNPQHINIYGNGEGRLPEKNSIPRTDDLAKNAIAVIGEGDGIFNDQDYILFYGWGPDRMYTNGTAELYQDRNPYSDVSCYFININPNEIPLRVQSVPSNDSPSTHQTDSYSFFLKHENDYTSLVSAGQRWYGELFDTELQRTFAFDVPDIVSSSPANFKSFIATTASSNALNTYSYSVNGTTLVTNPLPSTSSGYRRGGTNFSLTNPGTTIQLTMTVTRSAPDIVTYLDYIQLNARRSLTMLGSQFNFRDLSSVGLGNVVDYRISNFPSNGFVWDVTDRHVPEIQLGDLSGNQFVFRAGNDSLREYVVSNGSDFFTPVGVGQVEHQNLHGLPQAEYVIVSHPSFLSQANRLAQLHESQGMTVNVVSITDVYNEFSSGMVDATAVRMLAKMFYDRGASNPTNRIKYLCLFGDGTFDHKNKKSNANYVGTYQVENSENHISALVTDDYFGLLDDDDAIKDTDFMDIGVGRILVSSTQIAREQVDKIEHYMKNGSALYSTANTNCSSDNGSSTFGDWRLKYTQIADDEENGYFINVDCEPAYDSILNAYPAINTDKIYLDAYQQVVTAGGSRYPDVVTAINDRIEHGSLITNYIGHGGEVGAAEERIITIPQIQGWKNIDKLTIMVSATCEFTKYDDPSRVSAGEWASLNPYGGAIALMTTTRSVFFGVNSSTIKSFVSHAFDRDDNDMPLTLGEIIRRTKNTSGTSSNRRSFTLIGDPALQIALPKMNVVTDSINGSSPSVEIDTLNALSKVTIKGHLEDFNGNVLNNFNGVVYPTVFDKPKSQKTLGNDPSSPIIDFELQTNRIYRGKASVVNGYFEFTFIVPKDINYSYGRGKISYYAENGDIDALGSDTRLLIGGIDPNGVVDTEGPQIDLFLNEETFVSGGITDETPVLIAKVYDDNGINTVGNGVGHDLVAIVDGESGNPIVLNEYYTTTLDSYQSGEIRYNFSDLKPGNHTLSVKVWDVNNNSSEASLEFVVQEKTELALDHVLNYPNPFTTSTEFYFEHNQACVDLEAQIQIFTVSGRLVKTINQAVKCDGFRSKGIPWNGRDDFGDQLAKGVYVYRVSVKTPDGKVADKTEKLVILK